jgi:putative CocE/NonD family hydrolase
LSEQEEIVSKRIVTEFPYSVRTIEHEWIPLADGTRLAARMWMPEIAEKQPVPAILEYIPYRKRDGTRARDEPMHGFFSGHGYAVIRVDMRGTGESDGLLRDEYLLQEQDDALEVIDWISRQPWCTGNVGMMGKSWGGFNSLQVAARRPPALKAIITVGFTDDRYNDDIHYKGGCLLNDNLWWGAIMLAYQSRPGDPALLGESWRADWLKRLEEMPLWPALWMNHSVRDAYWRHGSVCEDWSAIRCPVLALDGWADSYTNTVLRLMENLKVPRRAIIGPWAHLYPHDGAPAPAIGFLQEGVRWWDHWLKGIDNGAMDGPMVQAWMEESRPPSAICPASPGRWISSSAWPSADVRETPWHLTYGRLLREPNEGPERIALRTPQNQGLLAGEWMGAGVPGESPSDQRLDDGSSLVFDGEVLAESLEIFGYPRFEVELSSDRPSAMLFARLSDVAPDGSVTRVSYGLMNLTHLEGHDRVVPLESGRTVGATVKLDCIAHRFAPGHRVRLSLATTFWPMIWPMPEEVTLTLGLETARLVLPVRTDGSDSEGPIAEPRSASLTPTTWLAQGRVDRLLKYDILTDTWTCITDGVGGVFGEGIYRFDEIDTTVEHNLKRELVLRNGDPLSARYVLTQTMKIGREGWWTDADIVVSMRGDLTHFILDAEMKVRENGKLVFEKTWDERIPRLGL